MVLRAAIRPFGTVAKYIPSETPDLYYEITGVFDENHQVVDPSTGALIDTQQPTFGIRKVDVVAGSIERHDSLEIKGILYSIQGKTEDGQGGVMLVLQRISGD